MSRIPNAVDLAGFIENYVADVGVSLVFGLGYYLFKSLKKKEESCWSDPKESLKSLKGKLEGALQRWHYAKTVEEYHELIKTNYGDIEDPFSIINMMNRKGIMPTIETYNALLLNCLIMNNNESAEQLREEILDPMGPVTPNIYTLNVLIKGLGIKYRDLLKNLEFGIAYEDGKQRLHSQFDQELIKLIESLEQLNVYMDLVAQNTILETLVEQQRLNDAWSQFVNMKRFFAPDMYTYTTLIKGIKQTAELNEEWLNKAFQIFHEAKSLYEVDESFFNSLLDACVKFNRMDRAEELFQEMKQKKGFVSEYTLNVMIKGYGKMMKLDKAHEMFKLIRKDCTPSTVSYGAMLNACVRGKDILLAEELVEEMTRNKVEKNIYIYSTMINGYRSTRNYSKAIELYDYLIDRIEHQDDSIQLNTVFFNSILDCCVDSFRYDKMNEIFSFMKANASDDKNSPQMDLITYSIVLKGYAKGNCLNKVDEIYSYLRSRKDFKLDEVLYNTIIDCYARHNDEENALKVYSDMKTNQIPMSVITYGVLIKLYCNLGNCNRAFELFDECVKSDHKPSVIIYQMLIKLQIKFNHIDRAITMFRNMLLKSVKTDKIIYELIIKSCIEQERVKEAAELTIAAVKEGIKLEKYIFNNLCEALLNTTDLKCNDKMEKVNRLLEVSSDNTGNFDRAIKDKLMAFINSNNRKVDGYDCENSIYNFGISERTYNSNFNSNSYYRNGKCNSNHYYKNTNERSLYDEVDNNFNNRKSYSNYGNSNYYNHNFKYTQKSFYSGNNKYEEKSIYSL